MVLVGYPGWSSRCGRGWRAMSGEKSSHGQTRGFGEEEWGFPLGRLTWTVCRVSRHLEGVLGEEW